MPRAQAGPSNPTGTGGVVVRPPVRTIGYAAEQPLAEGHRRGTADLAQRHSCEATCTSIRPS
jgi:hypothetical protein